MSSLRDRACRSSRIAGAVAAAAIAGLATATAANAQATLIAPQLVGERDTIGLAELATDPFGSLYATGQDDNRLLKFQADLTPVFDKTIADGRAIASDSAGRLFVAGNAALRRYTSSGLLLGEWNIPGGFPGGMSSDATDHFYLPEFNAGAPVLNEYAVVAGTPTVVASTPYVGTPNDGFVPRTFFETAVDAERDVYASGVTEAPESRFLHRYGPGLTGAPFTIKSCGVVTGCGWVNGLDVARLLTINGPADHLIADNYTSADLQVYSTGPGGQPVGLIELDLPGSPLMIPVDFASSDCTGSLYVLLAVFGGPGTTYSGSRIQRYDTGASTGPCPSPPLATLAGLAKQVYKLVPIRGASGPCVNCVALAKSGVPIGGRQARAAAKRKKKGLTLTFESASAGDVSFLFRGPTEGRGKPKRRGGFLYAAGAGANELKFTGVLKPGKPLRAGTYKTTVTDAAGGVLERFKLKVLAR